MGDPKKKKDQKENMPALAKGFSDSTTELQNLISDVRRMAADPDAAVARGRAIRAEVASGFGIQFLTGKYQKESQKQIQIKLVAIDQMIKDLEGAADISRAAGERSRRMVAEFAGGVYLRRNGLLAGAWTGRDTLPSMLAPGEMVLNPNQQARVRVNAGGDPFDGAGIPGYAGGTYVQTGTPVSSPEPLTVPISISIDRDGMVQAWAQSPDGRRVLVDVVQKAYSNDEIKFSRRF